MIPTLSTLSSHIVTDMTIKIVEIVVIEHYKFKGKISNIKILIHQLWAEGRHQMGSRLVQFVVSVGLLDKARRCSGDCQAHPLSQLQPCWGCCEIFGIMMDSAGGRERDGDLNKLVQLISRDIPVWSSCHASCGQTLSVH